MSPNAGHGISSSTHTKSLVLLLAAGVLYVVAMLTNFWFTMPPHSYYGLWSVTFCDFLKCQIISAMDDEAPSWYGTLQILSVLGLVFLSCSVLLLISSSVSRLLPSTLVCRQPSQISVVCILSVILLSTTLVMFYANLLVESSGHYHPYFSWSSLAACLACLLEGIAAFSLTHDSANAFI